MPRRKPGRPTAKRAVDASPCESQEAGCELSELFRLLGRAHVLDILHVLTEEGGGPRRFVDLQHRLHLSPNTLSDRLKELVAAGLATRTAYNEIPPRVDYEATEKARAFRPVFHELADWARRHNLSAEPPAAAPEARA